jgi:hypothetical protein
MVGSNRSRDRTISLRGARSHECLPSINAAKFRAAPNKTRFD